MRTLAIVIALAASMEAQDVPRTRGGTTENPPVNQPRAGKTPGAVSQDPKNRQNLEKPSESKPPATRGLGLTARLVDPESHSRRKAAAVQVSVGGLKLVDPDQTGRNAKSGEGHLLYRLDDGPVIATTATKLGFRQLSSGSHKLEVMLAGNDETPLGPRQTVDIKIP